jgi:hypothetical protein
LRIVATGPIPVDILEIGESVYVLAVNPADETVMLISEDGSTRRTVGASAYDARAASFGDRAVVSITAKAGDETDISRVVVDAALQDVAPQERLTSQPAMQMQPAIARNAFGEALAVWIESGRADGAALMGARLDSAGRPIGAPFRIAGARPYSASIPHLASDGTDFLVVDLGLGVRVHRVLRDGTVQAPVSIPTSGSANCVAWTGTEYLVGHVRTLVLTRQRHDVEVRAARVSAAGILGETIVVAPVVQSFYSLNCAAGEAATLFGWSRAGRIEATVVHDGGAVSGVIPVASTRSFAAFYNTPFPAVAANGNTFLVGWYDENTVRWSTMNEHGTVSPSGEQVPLDVMESAVKPAAASAFEDGFMLAWGTLDLRALALDASGRSRGTTSLSETPALERTPALAAGNDVLAAYVRDTGSETVPYWRVFTRTLNDNGPRQRSVRH